MELFATIAIVTQGFTLDIGRGLGYASNKILSDKPPNACYNIVWKPSETKNIKDNKTNFELQVCWICLELITKMPCWLRTNFVS